MPRKKAKTKNKVRKKAGSARGKRNAIKNQLSVRSGFGKPWTDKCKHFRVEFNWCDEEEEQTNEVVHFAEVKDLDARERKLWTASLTSKGEIFGERESVESKLLLVYLGYFVCKMRSRGLFNTCFVYPISSPKSQKIRSPLYLIEADENFCKTRKIVPKAIEGMIARYIRHEWDEKEQESLVPQSL